MRAFCYRGMLIYSTSPDLNVRTCEICLSRGPYENEDAARERIDAWYLKQHEDLILELEELAGAIKIADDMRASPGVLLAPLASIIKKLKETP